MDFTQPLTVWACHLNLTLPCGFSRWLHWAGSWQHPEIMLLTQTLVGGVSGGPGPGSVLVKGVTFLAVSSHGVMLAGTNQVTTFPLNALTGMTVTLAPKWKKGIIWVKYAKTDFFSVSTVWHQRSHNHAQVGEFLHLNEASYPVISPKWSKIKLLLRLMNPFSCVP